ncbi:methyltransferase family protein [Nitrosospira sp. Nsp2]|uniref:class I SAM-dependent methyltransferase n=1 Tax=Nitrosospira sp. Nsp2 TaxID=136548 RepID=UPI000D31062B|nr:class I SAM-dependent methyltransferase [Nitrosospira sp. Nsp2]PTR15991.1 methyltransferase family protein [Nitrosospira sp. Nsp2]
MHLKETGQSYDAIAHIWREDRIQSNGIPQLERAIRFARNRRFALDIGCGCSGRFDVLGKHGFQVEGVDVSQELIALARQSHPGISFHHADICEWNLPRKYDFVVAWDSIWHIPLDRQEPVLRKISEGMAPGGVFMFTTGGLDNAEEECDSCMGPPVYYSALGIPKTLELLTRFGCVCRHLEYDQYPEQHLYIIAQKA